MICRSCLRRGASSLRQSTFTRPLSISPRSLDPSATPPAAAQPFSTPLSGTASTITPKTSTAQKAASQITSICPAGTSMKGINYIKGKDDPVALEDGEYPEWLWHILDVKVVEGASASAEQGDEFSKSKKLRRAAAKRQRKLEMKMKAEGKVYEPPVPITQQSVDFPEGEPGMAERGELKKAMRRERRAAIKERNYLKGM